MKNDYDGPLAVESESAFVLPAGLIGRFAVVKLWPEIKTAEDECIARQKIAAQSLGLECIEIHADGRLIEDPTVTITKKDIDFVLHLHYDTPKLYDAFSFVALWNPLHFYHEWGYVRCSRNLLTHDDFLSCCSPAADAHVGRMIRNVKTHLPPFFNLFHSVSDVAHSPSLGDFKLFYAGINWEAVGRGKSRHQELLKRLDRTGDLRIYGPDIFLGVKVWGGYKSYVREIPFDGVSILDEISKAGVALVLSSQAHKEDQLMSSRLFESIAAGALVICDENNFAKKFFGDSLLYIDTRCSVEQIQQNIFKHLDWAKANTKDALNLVTKAQAIFREKFTIKKNLRDLYLGFSDRKSTLLRTTRNPENYEKMRVSLNLLLPEYSEVILNNHIASVIVQEYENFSAVIVIDKIAASKNRISLNTALAKSLVPIELLEVDFFTYSSNSQEIKNQRKFGAVIAEVLEQLKQIDAVVFVAPNEKIFSNHLQVLAGSLIRNAKTNCAATAMILAPKRGSDMALKGVYEKIDFHEHNQSLPNGYARFIFRVSAFPNDLHLALPYVNKKGLAILVGESLIYQELPATVVIDTAHEFPLGALNEGLENAIIVNMFPNACMVYKGFKTFLNPFKNSACVSLSDSEMSLYNLVSQLIYCWIRLQVRAWRRDGFVNRLIYVKKKFFKLFHAFHNSLKLKVKQKLFLLNGE